ncbi:hypothetical protein GLAREA_07975 [Glarea lozoyensis ATCC 20868]|uniref:Uncharacterized protein n=1 Tax=Glarea lozoyensis (strain ATCC 20868 / MF5171) TaxID=1116229 RepID=S3CDN3_GLAL2|nr:uncharacterized protein GLAREA_07975 [Glarea lozoyensis ATCC 20868]EPE24125.1 hypothetical protein GLAREA_07975 [Glarea lozoyensis ATCC 20868]
MYIRALLVLCVYLDFGVTHPSWHTPTIEQRQVPSAEPSPADYPDILDGKYQDPNGGPSFPPLEGVFPNTYIDPKCTNPEIKILKDAWEGAKLVAMAQNDSISGYDYNFAHSTWIGDNWNERSNHKTESRSSSITANIKQLARLFGGKIEPDELIVWRCSESSKPNIPCDLDHHHHFPAITKHHRGR